MRHVNPNMYLPVLEGIAEAEQVAGDPVGELMMIEHIELVRQLHEPAALGSFRVGLFLKAKTIARAQGFIAAYRSAEL